ncbi:MAG: NrfD/PsrC family molybdoenzyme membrane anchor subunit, partial [Planctomycetota bacterium]
MRLTNRFGPIAALAILILAGMVAAVRQLTVGLGATALDEPVVWGLYVVCFAYFAGIGAGALTVASATIWSGQDQYRHLTRAAAVVSLSSLVVAGLFITMDLGRPDRVLLLVLKAKLQSPLIW